MVLELDKDLKSTKQKICQTTSLSTSNQTAKTLVVCTTPANEEERVRLWEDFHPEAGEVLEAAALPLTPIKNRHAQWARKTLVETEQQDHIMADFGTENGTDG